MSLPAFSSAILKLTSFCNLNCSYCYMFNLADRTYERMPRFMPPETAVAVLERLAAHARRHGLARIALVLHGGEPALWPIASFQCLLDRIREVRRSGLQVELSLQSNGFLIERPLVDLLIEHGATLGFSLDGPEEHNDLFRVTHAGSGSYARVIDNIDRVLSWGFEKRRFGVLCAVNPRISPGEFLEWADRLPLNNISVLWPIQFSWSNPPWQDADEDTYRLNPDYGRWMALAFEQWWNNYLERLHISHFVDTLNRILGSRHHSDSIGNDFVDMFVVNCDGGIEYSDYFRAHADSGARTSYRIEDTDLDTLRSDSVFHTLLSLRQHLPEVCSSCRHAGVCGGGFLPGRSDNLGFDVKRRSVMCHDHAYYLDKVRTLVSPYIAAIAEA